MIKTAYSQHLDPAAAVADIQQQFGALAPSFIIYFASPRFDQGGIAGAIAGAFSCTSIGCSSSGELVSGHMLKQSVVAMGFDAGTIARAEVQVLTNISSGIKLKAAIKGFDGALGQPFMGLDIARYVGLVLVDGLRRMEESLLDILGDATDLTFIGGSAGDDLKFDTTWVHANGQVYTDAAVLAVLKPAVEFDILKTQSFNDTGEVLTATSVDEATRTVLEFNDKPAVTAYAEALGVSEAEAAGRFMTNPLGLMVGDEPYVRSPQKVDGRDMVFYCAVREGMELSLLESRNIVDDTKRDLDAKLAETGPLQGIVNFHCILRTLELENKGQTVAYGKLFDAIPTVGFSTYGEEYLGHINQTSTMLLFKDKVVS